MAYNTKTIINDANGKSVPQYYNLSSDQYEVLQGQNGAVYFIPVGRSAKQPFSGTANTTYTFTNSMRGFVISNDGVADLTFTISGDTYTVKSGEVFDDVFDPFTVVTVT